MTSKEQFALLKHPFPFAEIDIKVQSKRENRALAVCYLDARAARRRLDEVFGPENWRVSYRSEHVSEKARGVICRLEVTTVEGRDVVREDGSNESDVEPFKGAISDAFKRAFSALGHDALYYVELGWHPVDEKGRWTPEAMRKMREMYEVQTGLKAAA